MVDMSDTISEIGAESAAAVQSGETPELWTTDQVSAYTGIPVGTLENWRTTRRNHIPYVKLSGNTVRYLKSDVVDWILSKRVE